MPAPFSDGYLLFPENTSVFCPIKFNLSLRLYKGLCPIMLDYWLA